MAFCCLTSYAWRALYSNGCLICNCTREVCKVHLINDTSCCNQCKSVWYTGAADVITDLPAAEETAAQYGVEPVVVPGVAHDFMLVRSLAACSPYKGSLSNFLAIRYSAICMLCPPLEVVYVQVVFQCVC